MFLFYTRVNVLFLSCKKKLFLLYEHKNEERLVLEERSFLNIAKLKISKKTRQRLNEKHTKA